MKFKQKQSKHALLSQNRYFGLSPNEANRQKNIESSPKIWNLEFLKMTISHHYFSLLFSQ